MSKLSEALKAHQTGNHGYKRSFNHLSIEGGYKTLAEYQIEYSMSCTLQAKFYANNLASGEDLTHCTVKVKRAILEEVFGEFRKDFYELDAALYYHDTEKAKELLDKIKQSMYDY